MWDSVTKEKLVLVYNDFILWSPIHSLKALRKCVYSPCVAAFFWKHSQNSTDALLFICRKWYLTESLLKFLTAYFSPVNPPYLEMKHRMLHFRESQSERAWNGHFVPYSSKDTEDECFSLGWCIFMIWWQSVCFSVYLQAPQWNWLTWHLIT